MVIFETAILRPSEDKFTGERGRNGLVGPKPKANGKYIKIKEEIKGVILPPVSDTL